MSTAICKDNLPSGKKSLNPQFASRIQPPSTLPLRTSSKIRQPHTTRNTPPSQRVVPQGSTSNIQPPRVSFLTPREVWSPLSTPIPGMNEIRNDVRLGSGPSKVPKYQLKDTGPIPLDNTKPPSTSIPRPQIRSRHSVARPSIKAHRQPSIQRSSLQIPRAQIRPIVTRPTPTQQSSRLPMPSSTARSRPSSLLPSPVSPISISKTRPASYQPVSSIPMPEPRFAQSRPNSFLPIPSVPTSVAPSREPSNQSIASSTCSSASSLARHRAIKGRGKDRSSFARLSSYSPPNHEALINAIHQDSEGEDTESTISDHSIRTVATVNPMELNPPPHERNQSSTESIDVSGRLYEGEPKSKSPPLSYINTQAGLTAPYLVPSTAPPMTLEWESDESSGEADDAERVWKELEVKLGRKVRGTSLRRGRWVVKPRDNPIECSGETHNGMVEDLDPESTEMETTSSGFSVSLYYSPQQSEDSSRPSESYHTRYSTYPFGSSPIVDSPSSATALFDMSAPLVPGGSKHGLTPWNTPLMNKESIKRGKRVKKKFASIDVYDVIPKNRLGSLEEDSRLEFTPTNLHPHEIQHTPEGFHYGSPASQDHDIRDLESNQIKSDDIQKPISPKMEIPMYRLDSHIISALSALQGGYDSPELDFALSSSPTLSPISMSSDEEEDDQDGMHRSGISGGLGLGMKLNLKTVYHMPTLSPRLRPSAAQKSIMVEKGTATALIVNRRLSDQEQSKEGAESLEGDLAESEGLSVLSILKDIPDLSPVNGGEETVLVNEADDEEVLVIRDLDTGLERQIRVGEAFTLT